MNSIHRTRYRSKSSSHEKKKIYLCLQKFKNTHYAAIIICVIVLIGTISYLMGRNRISLVTTTMPVKEASVSVDIPPQNATIFLTKNGWTPAILKIKKGTTVNWVNESFEDASVSGDSSNIHSLLNLGVFSRGDTISLTFSIPGEYTYINKLQPKEQGIIQVR